MVTPAPRSHTRIVISDGPSRRMNSTLVRCGKRSATSTAGPMVATAASGSSWRITACGLPIETSARVTLPAGVSRASSASPAGKRALPMSTETIEPSTATRTSPAPVMILPSAGSAPVPSRYRATIRMPLPQFSAMLPSGFHTRISGTGPSMRTSRIPSAPTPKLRSQTSRARAAVMGNGHAADSVTT